jgi:hypothetical protein
MPTSKRAAVDRDGLTALGRRWRQVALGHERMLQAMMFDLVRLRLAHDQDLDAGLLPTVAALARAAEGRCALCGQGLPQAEQAAAGGPGAEPLDG